MVCGDLVADEEPLDDRARDREQHDQERQAVPALILLQGLRAEGAEETAGAVGKTHPRAHDDRGLFGLADVSLRSRGGLSGPG